MRFDKVFKSGHSHSVLAQGQGLSDDYVFIVAYKGKDVCAANILQAISEEFGNHLEVESFICLHVLLSKGAPLHLDIHTQMIVDAIFV